MASKKLSTTMVDTKTKTKTKTQQSRREKDVDRRLTSSESDHDETNDLEIHFHQSRTDEDLISQLTSSTQQPPSLASTTVSSLALSPVPSTLEEKAATKTADTDLESRHRPPRIADTAFMSPPLSTPQSLRRRKVQDSLWDSKHYLNYEDNAVFQVQGQPPRPKANPQFKERLSVGKNRLKKLDPLKDSKHYLKYEDLAVFQVHRQSPRPKPNAQFKTIRERLLFGEDHSEKERSTSNNTKKQEAVDDFKRAERERSLVTTPTQRPRKVLTGSISSTPRQSRRVSSPQVSPGIMSTPRQSRRVSSPQVSPGIMSTPRQSRRVSSPQVDRSLVTTPTQSSRKVLTGIISTPRQSRRALSPRPGPVSPPLGRNSGSNFRRHRRQSSTSKVDPDTAEPPHPRSRRRASIAASMVDVGNPALWSPQKAAPSSLRSLSTIGLSPGLSPRGTISRRRRKHTDSPRHSWSKIGMVWSDRNTKKDKKGSFFLQPPEL
jgi:hypothetical protein